MKPIQITIRDDHGQDNYYTVGKYGVLEIIEHKAQGEGDKWYYDVVFEDSTVRLFKFESVKFENLSKPNPPIVE